MDGTIKILRHFANVPHPNMEGVTSDTQYAVLAGHYRQQAEFLADVMRVAADSLEAQNASHRNAILVCASKCRECGVTKHYTEITPNGLCKNCSRGVN